MQRLSPLEHIMTKKHAVPHPLPPDTHATTVRIGYVQESANPGTTVRVDAYDPHNSSVQYTTVAELHPGEDCEVEISKHQQVRVTEEIAVSPTA